MKKITLLAVALVMAWLGVAQAQVLVDPYLRRDGTYVDGHYRSNPDGNPYSNWSYPGNVNPYTGKQATGDPNRYSNTKIKVTDKISISSIRISSAGN
jgi:hypothetical protein